jgi:hypothetical protein
MIPYGSKRTYAECTVVRYRGGKVHIKQTIKSRKYGRKFKEKDIPNELQD